MNTTIFVKEGRPLFWPWCAVMLTGVVSLLRPSESLDWIGTLGIVLGIPLLATLPFGNEFQNRTLSLLLSQPVGRGRIWIEKSVTAFLAVASVVIVFAFSPLLRGEQAYALALIAAVAASSTFWTLIARSTIGGIALSLGSVLIVAASISLATGLGANSLLVMTHFTAISITPLLGYAALMFWLGQRTLARYQVTGNMAGDDLLTVGSDAILGAFSRGALANPARPLRNLIRKELRLLRPVWLLTVLAAVAWTCLAFVDLARQQKTPKTLSLPIIAMGLSCAFIVAILAGCLSLGEEKTSGTYAWHRTLPISPARQWSIKLFVALFVSFVCSVLVPGALLTAGGRFSPSAFPGADAKLQLMWLLGSLLLTLFSFWCACAVNGTVTAVGWIVPILALVMATPQMTYWAGRRLVDFLVLKFNLLASFRFTVFLSNLNIAQNSHSIFSPFGFDPLLVWIPALILAVIQSYWLFRTPIRQSAVSVARKLAPLVVFALLCSISVYAFAELSNYASARVYGLFFAVHDTIQNVLSDPANRNATQPLQLSVDEIRKAYPPRVHGSPWLDGSTLTIVPDKAHPTTCCVSKLGPHVKPWWNYTATVHLATGAELFLSFEPPAGNPTGLPRGKLTVRWPNGTSEQTVVGRSIAAPARPGAVAQTRHNLAQRAARLGLPRFP